MIKIMGAKGGVVEVIDECIPEEADYLVGEYRMAFGPGWAIWKEKEDNE